MTRKSLLAVLMLCSISLMAQSPKYIFLFIGDGMGLNQIHGTESYLAELQGRIGIEPLCFGNFPYTALGTSCSQSNGITDSAAGGTALACGTKTYNDGLGVDAQKNPINSIAYYAKQSGKRVGVCTTVSIDHATPGAFYAHVPSRNMYHQIGHQMAESNYDFFGGADFRQQVRNHDGNECNLHKVIRDSGYDIAYGYQEGRKAIGQSKKLFLTQSKEATRKYGNDLPYAIDRQEGDLKLKEIVEVGIDFLMKDCKKGFFLMTEGGKIDYACHAQDGATMIKETIDFDEAIKVAYEFYKKHPKETLIIVTADHETGGVALGNSDYDQRLKFFQYQTCSVAECSKRLGALRKDGHEVTWEEVKAVLTSCYGLFDKVAVSSRDEKALQTTFTEKFNKGVKQESLYQSDDALASEARGLLNKLAKMGWTSWTHTNGYIPIFAVGAGAEQFHGRIDNTDIPKIISRVAKYK